MHIRTHLTSPVFQLFALILLLSLALIVHYAPDVRSWLPGEPAQGEEHFRVEQVVDGDTLRLNDGRTIRLIGVDTPELHHPDLPVQRFAKEAAAFTHKKVEGRPVTLTFNPQDLEDAYGRTLAYVFAEGKLLNKAIITQGYGYAMTRFPHPKLHEFVYAEQQARSMQRGLWNYSLTDARITNLAARYERLSPQGKAQLDEFWDELLQQEHPPTPELEPRTISWQDAARHYGEYCVVEGTIVRSHTSSKVCFLNFHPDWRQYGSLVIFARQFPKFPKNPGKYYLHKTVRVTGYINEYKGTPEIILDSPKQIEILP